MPVNAFLDETRSERLDIGLPFLRQLRVSPTLESILLAEKPTTMTWGDFALLAMIQYAVTCRSVRGDLRGTNGLLVSLGAVATDGSAANLTAVRTADDRQEGGRKPPAKVAAR